jgi:hypothetical protein
MVYNINFNSPDRIGSDFETELPAFGFKLAAFQALPAKIGKYGGVVDFRKKRKPRRVLYTARSQFITGRR